MTTGNSLEKFDYKERMRQNVRWTGKRVGMF